MAKPITLFGLKKVVDVMKAHLENTPINPEVRDDAAERTVFQTGSLKVIFSVVKFEVPLLDPFESETRYQMEIHWEPATNTIPSVWYQQNFASALSALMGAKDNRIAMRLEDQNIPIMYRHLQVALDAQMCAGCGINIVPHELMECYACMMRLNQEDDAKHVCGVCHDKCCAKMEQTPCCDQFIHRVCKNKWHGSCPFCRA